MLLQVNFQGLGQLKLLREGEINRGPSALKVVFSKVLQVNELRTVGTTCTVGKYLRYLRYRTVAVP